MKKYLLLSPVLLMLAFLFLSFIQANKAAKNPAPNAGKFLIPNNVQQIIDQSCFGCHNMNAKNEKAKSKLMFEALDTLSVARLVGELADIKDEVINNKMPPVKYLEFEPKAALDTDQKKLLISWADSVVQSYIH